jgi:hypothetical protein
VHKNLGPGRVVQDMNRYMAPKTLLPISSFWSTLEVAKLDNRAQDITFAVRDFKVKRLDIAVTYGAW